MGEKLSYDSEGNYHDDNVRIERTDIAQADFNAHKPKVDPIFVERVVDKLQLEIGQQLRLNPDMSVNQIKMAALDRLMGLILKELLTNEEADKIYFHFARRVNYYYGTP
jgi:hypothetical protein